MEELLKKLEILIGTIEKSQSSEGEEVKKNLATLMEEVKKAGLTEEDKTRLAKMEELEKEIKKQAETIDILMKAGTTVPSEENDIKKFEEELNVYLKKGEKTETIKKSFDSTAGAVLIPKNRQHEIIKQILETSPVLKMAKVYRIGEGKDLEIPVKKSGTSNLAVQAEGAPRPSESTMVYDKIKLEAVKLTAWYNATEEMIKDSDFDIVSEIAESSREELAAYLSREVWNGNAGNKIEGIYKTTSVTSAALETATQNVVTWEDLDKLIFSLPPNVRANSVFIVSTDMLSTMSRFKDTNGNPLFSPSLVEGTPNKYRGYPIYEDTYMDNVAGNKYPVFFGDIKKFYTWLIRRDMFMERDRNAGPDTYDFYTRIRVGAKVRDENQGKLLKVKNV